MDYVYDLQRDKVPREQGPDEYEYIVEFGLGFVLDQEIAVTMEVGLYRLPEEEGSMDLKFGIRRHHGNFPRKADIIYKCGDVATYIPNRMDRGVVLELIQDCIRDLVAMANPRRIAMESYHLQLPDKAKRKYDVICYTLEGLGYRLVKQYMHQLHTYWVLEKRP